MTAEGTFPKSNGDIFYGSEANILALNQIYTGTGFDCSAANNTDEHSVELTALTSTQIKGANYVKISISFTSEIVRAASTNHCYASIKIQAKETGGAYGDDMTYKEVNGTDGGSTSSYHNVGSTLSWFHTLTSGEKTNGCQFKIFGKGVADGAGSTVTLVNIQTFEECQ